jgi:hypothetical protein
MPDFLAAIVAIASQPRRSRGPAPQRDLTRSLSRLVPVVPRAEPVDDGKHRHEHRP